MLNPGSRQHWTNNEGAAALEFAILAPVYLLLVAGMMAYGIYFGASHSIQQLAADAARTSVAGLNDTERDELVSQFLDRNGGGYVFIDPTRLTYVVGRRDNDPNQYQVTVRYDANALPIWNLYLPLPLPNRTISYSSTIRLGGI